MKFDFEGFNDKGNSLDWANERVQSPQHVYR